MILLRNYYIKSICIITFLIPLAVNLNAQSLTSLSKDFSPLIASRLYDIVSKQKLNVEDLIAFGSYFQTQDSTFQLELKKKLPVYRNLRYFEISAKDFNSLIKAGPEDSRFTRSNIPISKINYALLYRSSLKLNDQQIKELIESNSKQLVTLNDQATNETLVSCLNKVQLIRYCELLNQQQALNWCKKDWAELKKYMLTMRLDSTEVCLQFYILQMEKFVKSEYFNLLKKRDSVTSINSRFGKDRSKLLANILGQDQYWTYFKLVNEGKVRNIVNKHWQNVKQFKLKGNLDSTAIQTQLYNYEMELAFATERVYIDNTNKNLFQRQRLINNRPEVLSEIDKELYRTMPPRNLRF